jgi:hypothetical protein
MYIAQIDCFPAYCVERVTVAFVYDCSPVAANPVRSLLFGELLVTVARAIEVIPLSPIRRTKSGNSFTKAGPVPVVLAFPRSAKRVSGGGTGPARRRGGNLSGPKNSLDIKTRVRVFGGDFRGLACESYLRLENQ